jgi:pyruvate formate lyase activating enzyme
MKIEARYFKVVDENTLQCILCPNLCILRNNEIGSCKTRQNIDGKLYQLFYKMASSIAIDPIEKKPLYHFYPSSKIFSIGTVGCSFHCMFCQNYSISQFTDIHLEQIDEKEIYEIMKENNINLLAFTYNEPLIWYETVYDISKYLKEKDKNIKIVLVSNGYINSKPLMSLLPYIDAMNIDLKSFQNDFYKNFCDGKLEPVLQTIKTAAKYIHVEITTLVIPTLNDSEQEIAAIANFLSSINPDIPLHISKYYPYYKLNISPTSTDTILKLVDVAKKSLRYVYSGNIPSKDDSTYCSCGNKLIDRHGYTAKITGIKDGVCMVCGKKIYGKF